MGKDDGLGRGIVAGLRLARLLPVLSRRLGLMRFVQPRARMLSALQSDGCVHRCARQCRMPDSEQVSASGQGERLKVLSASVAAVRHPAAEVAL